MAKAQSIILLFVLIVATALAATAASADSLKDAPYIVIVGKDAPASDVVIAANFAASMKGSVAVTFTPAIDQDAFAQLTTADLASKTVIVINGQAKSAKLLGGNRGDAWDAASVYFQRMGFAVYEVPSAAREDVLLNAPPKPLDFDVPNADLPGAGVMPAPNATGSLPPGDNHPAVVVASEAAPQENASGNGSAQGMTANSTGPAGLAQGGSDAHAAQDHPGFFKRIWNWISGLFG